MSQADRQRARQARLDPRLYLEAERRIERLVAEVLDALAQRDAFTRELERVAGRRLEELAALGSGAFLRAVNLTGLGADEVRRLRALAVGEPRGNPGSPGRAAGLSTGSVAAERDGSKRPDNESERADSSGAEVAPPHGGGRHDG